MCLNSYSIDTNCVKWRQTGGCNANGPREPDKDKSCFQPIVNHASGFCECTDGTKAVEKGCNDPKFETCYEACKIRLGIFVISSK